jgi:hypothetical protein
MRFQAKHIVLSVCSFYSYLQDNVCLSSLLILANGYRTLMHSRPLPTAGAAAVTAALAIILRPISGI